MKRWLCLVGAVGLAVALAAPVYGRGGGKGSGAGSHGSGDGVKVSDGSSLKDSLDVDDQVGKPTGGEVRVRLNTKVKNKGADSQTTAQTGQENRVQSKGDYPQVKQQSHESVMEEKRRMGTEGHDEAKAQRKQLFLDQASQGQSAPQ